MRKCVCREEVEKGAGLSRRWRREQGYLSAGRRWRREQGYLGGGEGSRVICLQGGGGEGSRVICLKDSCQQRGSGQSPQEHYRQC